jgi:branched-subunit amino acid ABC-type transport system permease component
MGDLGTWLQWLLIAMGVALAIAGVGLALVWRSVRRLRVPPDADFFTTMRYIPFILVVLLDLLDFGLDVLAAPVSWLVLDRLGLKGLRNKAAIEALIPLTQPIPTFSLGWIAARVLNLGEPPGRAPRYLEGEYYESPRR